MRESLLVIFSLFFVPAIVKLEFLVTGPWVFVTLSNKAKLDQYLWSKKDPNSGFFQPVRLLVSARAYQPANHVFLSQQINTSQAY